MLFDKLKIEGYPREKLKGSKSGEIKSAYINTVLAVTCIQAAIDSEQFSLRSKQSAYLAEGDLLDALKAIRNYMRECDKRNAEKDE